MTHLSHENALYGRISQARDSVTIDIPSCPVPPGYALLKVPIALPDCTGFGVAVTHSISKSVPFWAQVSVLSSVDGSSRLAAHVVSRRSSEYEHRDALKGILKHVLFHYLAPEFDLVLSRVGMDWHIWLSMLSMLSNRGLAVYAPRWPGQKLERLDADDLGKQNEDICDLLMSLDPGITIASWNTKLAGRSANLDEQLIDRLDNDWRELNR
jgi:hypothetical protein